MSLGPCLGSCHGSEATFYRTCDQGLRVNRSHYEAFLSYPIYSLGLVNWLFLIFLPQLATL